LWRLKKNASDAGPNDSVENSGKKHGRRIENDPDPDSPTAQDSGRAGDLVSRAAKEAEDSKAERQTRRRGDERKEKKREKRKMKKDTNGREEPNGRPPDLVTYNLK
jgi:hypothetical protein